MLKNRCHLRCVVSYMVMGELKIVQVFWAWDAEAIEESSEYVQCWWEPFSKSSASRSPSIDVTCSVQFSFISIKNTKSNNIKIIKNHKHRMEMQWKAKAWYLLHPLKEQKQFKTIQDKTRRYKTNAEAWHKGEKIQSNFVHCSFDHYSN